MVVVFGTTESAHVLKGSVVASFPSRARNPLGQFFLTAVTSALFRFLCIGEHRPLHDEVILLSLRKHISLVLINYIITEIQHYNKYKTNNISFTPRKIKSPAIASRWIDLPTRSSRR